MGGLFLILSESPFDRNIRGHFTQWYQAVLPTFAIDQSLDEMRSIAVIIRRPAPSRHRLRAGDEELNHR